MVAGCLRGYAASIRFVTDIDSRRGSSEEKETWRPRERSKPVWASDSVRRSYTG